MSMDEKNLRRIERETDNVLSIKNPSGTIEIKPHPEEVIDVDPAILALMEARLAGKSFADVYGDEDKVSQEFLIRKEVQKLTRVFENAEKVHERFQSIKTIKAVRDELQFEEVNRELLGQYILKKSGGASAGHFFDEADLYFSLLSGQEAITKEQRFSIALKAVEGRSDLRDLLLALKSQYLASNLEPLQITKEVIQLSPVVMNLVKDDLAVTKMNDLLALFYGGQS